MKEIFFDEAGNTGPDLLNKDQTVYVLCSTDLDNNKSKILLESFFKINNEVHFKNKRKTDKGKKQILTFIKTNKELLKEHCKISLYHKEFLANCYFIDYFIEPIFYEYGIDFLNYGMNIAFSNMFYICLQTFCGKDEAINVYQSFINFLRNKTDDNKYSLKRSISDAKKKCNHSDFKNQEIFLMEEGYNNIDKNLSQLNGSHIDPTLPAFIYSIQSWMEKYQDGVIVNHDESNTMLSQKSTIDFLSTLDGKNCNVGYGEFKSQYPLNIKNLSFCKSNNSFSIQICDLLASAFAFINNHVRNTDLEFADNLKKLLLNDFPIENLIWPDTNVLPQENRKRNDGDINPVDYLAYQYYIKNNK